MKSLVKFLVTTFIAILTGDIVISTVPLLFSTGQGLGRGWELQLAGKDNEVDTRLQYFPYTVVTRIVFGVSCVLAATFLAWRKIKKEAGERRLVEGNVAFKRPSDEGVQQEVGESGDVRPLLSGCPQLRSSDELPSASEREPRQKEIEQDCIQPSEQTGASPEEQLDPEERDCEENGVICESEEHSRAPSSRGSNTSLQNQNDSPTSFRDDLLEPEDHNKIEERIISFEQRLEAVESGLKDTETITKMWSERIEQAEGELMNLHKQMYEVLSRSPSEIDGDSKSINNTYEMQDSDNVETLKNISAIIEETKHQVAQMSPIALGSRGSLNSGEDFNPMELPILVRIPSIEPIPCKEIDSGTTRKTGRSLPPLSRGNKGRPEVTCKVPTRYVSTSKKPVYYDASAYVANKCKSQNIYPRKPSKIESNDLIRKYTFLSSVRKGD